MNGATAEVHMDVQPTINTADLEAIATRIADRAHELLMARPVVLHITPADVLLIGNVPNPDAVDAEQLTQLREATGAREVFLFPGAVDVAVVKDDKDEQAEDVEAGALVDEEPAQAHYGAPTGQHPRDLILHVEPTR